MGRTTHPYKGAAGREEVIGFMNEKGLEAFEGGETGRGQRAESDIYFEI
jgi:hypothetical protein